MRHARHLLVLALAGAFGAAQAQDPGSADAGYIARIDGRFAAFAGSSGNLQSLALGLRHGEAIVLTETVEPVPAPPPGAMPEPPAPPATTTIVPPTRPMGYGNVTRTLDLASRQLAGLGITEPTPAEIGAALNGGTVTTAAGEVTLSGVLTLRSEGKGWGQIARAIGVHPGMGSAKALPPVSAPLSARGTGSSGITTAAGGAGASSGDQGRTSTPATGRGGGVTNAAGAAAHSPATGAGLSRGHGRGNSAGGRGGGRS